MQNHSSTSALYWKDYILHFQAQLGTAPILMIVLASKKCSNDCTVTFCKHLTWVRWGHRSQTRLSNRNGRIVSSVRNLPLELSIKVAEELRARTDFLRLHRRRRVLGLYAVDRRSHPLPNSNQLYITRKTSGAREHPPFHLNHFVYWMGIIFQMSAFEELSG